MKTRFLNVSNPERMASVAVGSLLAYAGIKRRRPLWLGLAGLGAVLLKRGMTGECDVYRSIGVNTRKPQNIETQSFNMHLAINIPAEQVLEQAELGLPELLGFSADRCMNRLTDADGFMLEDGRGSALIRVVERDQGHSCHLSCHVHRNPKPESKETFVVKQVWEHRVAEALRNFKALLETGEIATTEGQSHGKRSLKASFFIDRFEGKAVAPEPERVSEETRASEMTQANSMTH